MISQDQVGGTRIYESIAAKNVKPGWWVRDGQTWRMVSDVYVDEVLIVVTFVFDHGDYSTTMVFDPEAIIQVVH